MTDLDLNLKPNEIFLIKTKILCANDSIWVNSFKSFSQNRYSFFTGRTDQMSMGEVSSIKTKSGLFELAKLINEVYNLDEEISVFYEPEFMCSYNKLSNYKRLDNAFFGRLGSVIDFSLFSDLEMELQFGVSKKEAEDFVQRIAYDRGLDKIELKKYGR